MVPVLSFSQDKRTLETKIADLVAQLPTNDLQYLNKLMGDMLSLGEAGLARICDQVIPARNRGRYKIQVCDRVIL